LDRFLRREEAVNHEWKDPDNRYGSRQMAAKLAFERRFAEDSSIAVDHIVGSRELRIKRDANSASRSPIWCGRRRRTWDMREFL